MLGPVSGRTETRHTQNSAQTTKTHREEPQLVVGEDVHLADLAEAARGAERLQAQPLVLARQRVEHDVDALVVRVAHELLSVVRRVYEMCFSDMGGNNAAANWANRPGSQHHSTPRTSNHSVLREL